MSIIDALLQPRILVLGDLILDRYTWGDAERVSPEAPVLVLRVDSREVRLGGAGSVAMLLRGLEVRDQKTRNLRWAVGLFLIGFALYCAAIYLLLLS